MIRLDWTKFLDDAKEFLSKDKSTSQHAVKDYESVMKSLSHEKTEKTPKMKKPLVELFQKWKERTPRTVDEMAAPDPENA